MAADDTSPTLPSIEHPLIACLPTSILERGLILELLLRMLAGGPTRQIRLTAQKGSSSASKDPLIFGDSALSTSRYSMELWTHRMTD